MVIVPLGAQVLEQIGLGALPPHSGTGPGGRELGGVRRGGGRELGGERWWGEGELGGVRGGERVGGGEGEKGVRVG